MKVEEKVLESVQGADSGWKCCCTRHTSSKYCSAAASFTSYYFETCLLISFFAITVVKFLSIQSEATPNGALLLLLLRFIHLLLFFAVWTHSSSFLLNLISNPMPMMQLLHSAWTILLALFSPICFDLSDFFIFCF